MERGKAIVFGGPVGAGRGCGDGASAGWRVVASSTLEAPAIVAGLDDAALFNGAVGKDTVSRV
jgi:hypothetical protein